MINQVDPYAVPVISIGVRRNWPSFAGLEFRSIGTTKPNHLGGRHVSTTESVSAYRFECTAFMEVDIMRDCNGSFSDFNLIQ